MIPLPGQNAAKRNLSETPPLSIPFILGWEEWVALPDLGLPSIKAKVDTGAKTSALHASLIEPFGPPAAPMARFVVHPVPGREDITVTCSSPVIGRREVTSSNGDRENRFVILARLCIGGRDWPIEVTLTNRASMTYRMLLGRQAIREDIFVDPTSSFRQPRLSYKLYHRLSRRSPIRRALRLGIVTKKPEAASVCRLGLAAAERDHVLETIDLDAVSLSFDEGVPGFAIGGAPGPHYDAVIPRVGERGQPFAAAAVRQLEMMGSFALNPGDALDWLRDPLAVLQRLIREGLPATASKALRLAGIAPGLPSVSFRLLVIGGRVEAVLERRGGRVANAPALGLDQERQLAVAAARVLRLGLAMIEVGKVEKGATITAINAVPPLSRFETITGVPVARQIIALVESRVRSCVRVPDTLAPDVIPDRE